MQHNIVRYLGIGAQPTERERIAYFTDHARGFDKGVLEKERRMGTLKWRQDLFSKARGDVLEIAAGTGRNLMVYRKAAPQIASLTMMDCVDTMLNQCEKKVYRVFGPERSNGWWELEEELDKKKQECGCAIPETEDEVEKRLLKGSLLTADPGAMAAKAVADREKARQDELAKLQEKGGAAAETALATAAEDSGLGYSADDLATRVIPEPQIKKGVRDSLVIPKWDAEAYAADGESNLLPRDAQSFDIKLDLGNAHDLAQYDDNSFDTVVMSMCLCSCEEPEQALHEASRVVKPTGRILLLEHGRSRFWPVRWFFWYMGLEDEKHAWENGCFDDRQPLDLVKNVGLPILKWETWICGHWYLITAGKAKARKRKRQPGAEGRSAPFEFAEGRQAQIRAPGAFQG